MAVEDKLIDKWSNQELFPAGKNIFGQDIPAVTIKDVDEMAMGYVSPFSTLKSANIFMKLIGGLKKWKGYKLPFSSTKAEKIIQKTVKATGVPRGKLTKFAQEKISGLRPAVKENRKFHEAWRKKHGKGWREDVAGPKGKWKGGTKYDIKGTVNEKDLERFLIEK